MTALQFIDLFAGAGGLSEGFIQQGFKAIAHVESDGAACFTLKTRAAFHYLQKNKKIDIYYSYLKGKITRDELYAMIPEDVLSRVINARIGDDNKAIFTSIDKFVNGKPVDLIIGGPPCQAYSVVGRAPLKHKKNDERTKLYVQYGRFLKKYKPKAFIFENVPGLLSAGGGLYFKNLQKYYKRLGYCVEAKLQNAQDFGVIQSRSRMIIIGWKKNISAQYPEMKAIKQKYFRDDIFADLPVIAPGEYNKIHRYSKKTNKYLEVTSIRNGVGFVTQHNARPHNQKDLKIYKLAIESLLLGKRLKNNQIPNTIRTQKNTTDFLDRFKVVGNLPHTVIAHISKDGHHFIHPDISQLRSISVREAARIQSFPDNFYFEGYKKDVVSLAPAFRQIGNAVPPLMAKKLASKIKEILS